MSPEAQLDDGEVSALVRHGYDATAERYLALVTQRGVDHPSRQWVAHLLHELPRRSRVVDLGCGPAVPTGADIAAAGHTVIGVDLSWRQLQLARTQVPTASLLHASMVDVAFSSETVDAVVALYSVTHVPRRRYGALLARIHGWLRPGGWLLANFGVSESAGWLEEDLLDLGAPSWTNSYGPGTTMAHVRTAGFVTKDAALVETEEASGAERWLWFLGHRA